MWLIYDKKHHKDHQYHNQNNYTAEYLTWECKPDMHGISSIRNILKSYVIADTQVYKQWTPWILVLSGGIKCGIQQQNNIHQNIVPQTSGVRQLPPSMF